jgi:hypothetical protein
MSFEETASHVGWLGNVTISTGGVAVLAMVAEHLFQRGMILRGTASVELSPISLQGGVQAVRKDRRDIHVAVTARVRFAVAWASDQILMRGVFIRRLRSLMTIRTGDMPMNSLRELFPID